MATRVSQQLEHGHPSDVVRVEREYLAHRGWTAEQLRLLEANAPEFEEMQALRLHNAKRSTGLRDIQRVIEDGERLLDAMQAPVVSARNLDGTRAPDSLERALVSRIGLWKRSLVED